MWKRKYFALLVQQLKDVGEKIEEEGEDQGGYVEKLTGTLIPELEQSITQLLDEVSNSTFP